MYISTYISMFIYIYILYVSVYIYISIALSLVEFFTVPGSEPNVTSCYRRAQEQCCGSASAHPTRPQPKPHLQRALAAAMRSFDAMRTLVSTRGAGLVGGDASPLSSKKASDTWQVTCSSAIAACARYSDAPRPCEGFLSLDLTLLTRPQLGPDMCLTPMHPWHPWPRGMFSMPHIYLQFV